MIRAYLGPCTARLTLATARSLAAIFSTRGTTPRAALIIVRFAEPSMICTHRLCTRVDLLAIGVRILLDSNQRKTHINPHTASVGSVHFASARVIVSLSGNAASSASNDSPRASSASTGPGSFMA